jgi:lipid A oxidase
MSGKLRAVAQAVAVAVAGACFCSLPALAETQISVYGGANWNFGSDVKITPPGIVGGGSETRSIDWDGGSFEMPPYWGVRGTYWLSKSSNWGFALEYTHQKAIADSPTATIWRCSKRSIVSAR